MNTHIDTHYVVVAPDPTTAQSLPDYVSVGTVVGIGRTVEDAMKDAAEWADHPEKDLLENGELPKGWDVDRASDDLVAAVRAGENATEWDARGSVGYVPFADPRHTKNQIARAVLAGQHFTGAETGMAPGSWSAGELSARVAAIKSGRPLEDEGI